MCRGDSSTLGGGHAAPLALPWPRLPLLPPVRQLGPPADSSPWLHPHPPPAPDLPQPPGKDITDARSRTKSQELSAPGPTTPLSAPATTALIIPPNHRQFPFLPALASPPTLETAPSHTSYTKAGVYGEYTPYSDYNYPGTEDPGGQDYSGARWPPRPIPGLRDSLLELS